MKHTMQPALSAERALYLRQNRRRNRTVRLCRWGFLAAFLLAWEVAAELSLIDSFIFSQPSRIVRTYLTMGENNLWHHIGVTVGETLAGFLLGELSNAWVMEKIKERMKGKRLWVRTIGSSMVGYLFDTLPFVLIAFAGVVSTRELIMMLLFQYFGKLIIEATMGTPMAYAAIHLLKKYRNSF